MSTEDQKPLVSINLNSIISSIVLLVVGWVGMKTANNSDSLTELRATMPYIHQTVTELKAQLSSLVTRAEFDSRSSETKAQAVILESRVHTIEIELKAAKEARSHP